MTWPTTQVATSDLITAAQLNQLPIALAEASGAAASYTFSSIPSFWTHLSIRCLLQTASGSNTDTLKMTFNSDTTAGHYSSQRLRATDTTVDANGTGSSGYIDCGEVPGGNGGAFSAHEIWIPNYGQGKKRGAIAIGHAAWGSSDGDQYVFLSGGAFVQGQVISSINLTVGSDFIAGSIATLYGWGAI